MYLASAACSHTQGVFSGTMGCFAQVFGGLTPGWLGPREEPASVEDVAAHFAEVVDRTGYTVPQHITDEYSAIIRRFK